MNSILKMTLKRMKDFFKQIKSEKGFTLIEIMIVVAIIALIMGLVSPYIMERLDAAKVTTTKVKIKQLNLPLLEYSQLKGNYPSTEEGLQALITEKITREGDIKDAWGNPYQYQYPSENGGSSYDIWSYGADGREGGTGVNADIKSWEIE